MSPTREREEKDPGKLFNYEGKEYDKLRDLYYDPTEGFVSITKLAEKAKLNNINLTYGEINEWLKNQKTYQMNKKEKRQKEYSSIVANFPGDIYQMDVMIYDRFNQHYRAPKSAQFKYILTCIDVFSRKASAIPMKNMRMETIIENARKCFDELGRNPQCLTVDNQFNKKEFIAFLEENKIKAFFTDPYEINKNAIVERFNGTLAGLLQKWRVATHQHDWYNVVDALIYNYNNTKHRTLKATPEEVYQGDQISQQVPKVVPSTIKEYDVVRVKEKKKVFDKGDAIKYSDERYMVTEKKGAKYILENVDTGATLAHGLKDYQLKKI